MVHLLTYGPPTQDDISGIRAEWYHRAPQFESYVSELRDYEVVEWDEGTKYGCVVRRFCDNTYWYIRDIFQMYRKWLGPVIPYQVRPVKVEVTRYVRYNEQ